MADRAIGGESCRRVGGVRGVVVVGLVAVDARRAGQAVIVVYMALQAGQRGMKAGESKPRGRVIKRRSTPRRCRVASLAGGGETRCQVRRIIGGIVVVLVTRDAGRVGTGQIVIAVYVAEGASHRRVRPSERETRGGMVKCGTAPRRRRVTLLASGGERRLHVIGVGGAVEVRQVT